LYAELFTVWKREKNSEAVQPLSHDFFKKISGYLLELKQSRSDEKKESNIDSANRREVDYVEFMFSDLLKMRAKKIALLSLKDSVEAPPDLIEIEVGLINSLREHLREYREQCAQTQSTFEASAEKTHLGEVHTATSTQETSSLMLLRILQPIPKLVGIDLDEYGPFQPEDIVSLPRENALVLIARGAASEVKP
jgi:DNA replication factor GINS